MRREKSYESCLFFVSFNHEVMIGPIHTDILLSFNTLNTVDCSAPHLSSRHSPSYTAVPVSNFYGQSDNSDP